MLHIRFKNQNPHSLPRPSRKEKLQRRTGTPSRHRTPKKGKTTSKPSLRRNLPRGPKRVENPQTTIPVDTLLRGRNNKHRRREKQSTATAHKPPKRVHSNNGLHISHKTRHHSLLRTRPNLPNPPHIRIRRNKRTKMANLKRNNKRKT